MDCRSALIDARRLFCFQLWMRQKHSCASKSAGWSCQKVALLASVTERLPMAPRLHSAETIVQCGIWLSHCLSLLPQFMRLSMTGRSAEVAPPDEHSRQYHR